MGEYVGKHEIKINRVYEALRAEGHGPYTIRRIIDAIPASARAGLSSAALIDLAHAFDKHWKTAQAEAEAETRANFG
jgi:hypothetical protein